jgi:hypothetical protein
MTARRPSNLLAALAALAAALIGGVLLVALAPAAPAGSPGPVPSAEPRAADTSGFDHSALDRLLRTYVDRKGRVDYAALQGRRGEALQPYLDRLARADLAAMGRDGRLALWINAYNALTLDLVARRYPLETIWAATPGPAEPGKEESPFAVEVGPVADTMRTLDEIEHEIIRVRFDEPRIHAALVCAAESCPRLRREAYTGERLDRQLDRQMRRFLHDPTKNRIAPEADTAFVSRIFKWYGSDFGAGPDALQAALAPYFEDPVRRRLAAADYAVGYLDYRWALNDRPQ